MQPKLFDPVAAAARDLADIEIFWGPVLGPMMVELARPFVLACYRIAVTQNPAKS